MALTIPNTFVAGTKIEASPMNANFAEVANAVDKRGDTLTGNLAANSGVKVDGVDVSSIPVDGSGNFNPLFTFVVLEAATTAGIRLDLESGTLAVREGDDSGYGPIISGQHTVSGALLIASNDGGALGASGTAWSDLFLASGGVINWNAGDTTLTHATGKLTLDGSGAGSLEVKGAILPTVSNTPALGSTSLMWADLFLGDGAVINFNNGDVTVTHSTNTLAFAGASSGYTFDAKIDPASNDGAALGSGTVSWSDLFLASGGVVNFANGDVTVTHSAGALSIAGADINLNDKTLSRPVLKDYGETRTTPSSSSNTLTLDYSLSNVFRVATTENITTVTISNPPASGTCGSFTLIVDYGGAHTITWPASVRWPAATAPTQTKVNGKTDVFTFVTTDGGTKWFGFAGGLNFTS